MDIFTNGEEKIKVSICIATYKREDMLSKLLKSLEIQRIEREISLEAVVVDNNAQGSAKSVIDKFINSNKFSLKYFIQPIKNISITRNVGLENATGDYICFIDDDEWASENWITSFLKSLKEFKADGAFGYVVPIFDDNIPGYLKIREFYFTYFGETGTIPRYYFTTNAIIKSNLIKKEKISFEPDYGLTGGEDVHFFERLARKGANFICCREAITYEYMPKERGSIKYIFLRALQGGQSFIRRRIEMNNSFYYKVLISFKAISNIIYSIIIIFLSIFKRKMFVLGIMRMGAAIGKLRSITGFYKKIYE